MPWISKKPDLKNDPRYLEPKINENASLLAQTQTQKADKTAVWSMANMGQDIKEAMTGGSVAVVGEKSILNETIVNRQVYGRKTDFMIVDDTCNLIDRNKFIANKRVQGGTDGNLVDTAGFYASDFLEIQPNTVYYYGNIYTGYYAFYDINENYISGQNVASAENKLFSPFTTPENAYFMRISLNSSTQVPICWISKTNSMPADFRYKQIKTTFNDEQMDTIKSLANISVKENPITVDQTSFIDKVGNANPIDRSKIKSGFYIKGQSAGEETATASPLYVTDYSELLPNMQYYHYGLYSGYYAFYDADKNFISGSGAFVDETTFPNPFTTPPNTAYGRFTLNDSTKLDSCWINVENEVPTDKQYYALSEDIILQNTKGLLVSNPCDYEGSEITVFNKILGIGDSLTYGVFNISGGSSKGITKYGYPTYLTKLTGVETTNVGLASHDTKEWYLANDNADLSGHDCAIIQLGVNDVFKGTQAETPIYLANIVDYIKSQNQKIKIFVSTIIPAYKSTDYDAMSDIIRDFVASRNDCYLVDMAKYSRTKKGTVYERGHLTALGYLKLAEEYKAYISYIIANNLNDFKDVHFSNTDLVM